MHETIKWTNHSTSILQNVKIKAPYTDAYLACSGKVYEVHRMILSSCSGYFQEIFKQTGTETPFIIMANIKSKFVEYLLSYMYKGEVNISEKEIEELLDAAEYFKVKGLSQAVLNKEPSSQSKYSRDFNASVISDLTFSPPRKKKKTSESFPSYSKKGQGNVYEPYLHQGPFNYQTFQHPDPHIISKVQNYESNMNLTIPNVNSMHSQILWKDGVADMKRPDQMVDIIPKPNSNIDPNQSAQVWNQHKTVQEGFGAELMNTLANSYSKGQEYHQTTEKTAELKEGEENFSGEDSLSDLSEMYSSDEDPVMASKIKKIVRKTYKNMLTKFKTQGSGFKGTSISLQGRTLITLSTVSKGDGRRHNARVNYCYFCNSPQTQIWRHIKNVHKSEPQVTRICELKGSNDQKQEIEFLRNMGNFYHNKEVLNAGNGELKVYRRLDNNTQLSFKDFIPCPKCLLFLSRSDLWRHYKYKCMPQSAAPNGRPTVGHLGHLLFMSSVILGIQGNFKKSEKKVITRLKTDEISDIAIKDEVIMHLGSNLFENVREDRFSVVEQSMRLSARILLYVRRRLNQHYLTLYQILRPSYFAYVSEAIDVLSRYLQTEEPNSLLASLSSPELAYQLTNLVRKCLAVKLGMALKAHNEEDKIETNSFVNSLDKLLAGFASFNGEDKNLNMLEVDMESEVVIVEDTGPTEYVNEDMMWEGNRVFDRELHETVSALAEEVSISPPNARSVAALKRVPYTPTENEAIFKYFGELIDKGQMIKKEDIDRLFTSPTYAGELNNRSWKNIKYKVHNLIQKKNKQP
ncbi:Broad-complex core protein isoforms 1/2/3/4/5 [Armadillidium vulgare]|nr:Broad-complex core protein isoforms 1/2/3/4/5 [Armadillidium vulgare]